MQIRRLTTTDRVIYRATRLECLRTLPEQFGSTYAEESTKAELFFETQLIDSESPHRMYGAFDEDACVGLCGLVREQRLRTRHRAEIVQLYVAASHRRRGVGKVLLTAVLDAAWQDETLTVVELGVMADNDAAIKLYGELGFSIYGEHRRYFRLPNGDYLKQTLMAAERPARMKAAAQNERPEESSMPQDIPPAHPVSEADVRELADWINDDYCVLYAHRTTGQIYQGLNYEDHGESYEDMNNGEPNPDQAVIDDIEAHPEQWYRLERLDSNDSYRIMERFAFQLPDRTFGEQLLRAINQSKPFRRFGRLVDDSDYRQDWFDFRDAARLDYVRKQLANMDRK